MAIAINPFRWRGAETYTVVQSLANGENPIADYKKALETGVYEGYMTENSGINSLSGPEWLKNSLDVDDEIMEGEFE